MKATRTVTHLTAGVSELRSLLHTDKPARLAISGRVTSVTLLQVLLGKSLPEPFDTVI
jgi:hypothetical protein